jgi:hypothetical protein
VCEGALVFAFLRFNPFELLSSDVLRQPDAEQFRWYRFRANWHPKELQYDLYM